MCFTKKSALALMLSLCLVTGAVLPRCSPAMTAVTPPAAFNGSYRVDGRPLDEAPDDPVFIAAPGVSAMISPDNPPWLNNIWDNLQRRSLRSHDYYANTLKLPGMVVMSGHWERPSPALQKKPTHLSEYQPLSEAAAQGTMAYVLRAPFMFARGMILKKLLRRRAMG